MHNKTTLLLLSFLLATLLSLTTAYPQPKSLDLRGFSAATASTSSSRTNTQSSRTQNNANKQQQQQHKKEKEHDGPDNKEKESHASETSETGGGGGGDHSSDTNIEDGDGKKMCRVPLSQRFAAQYEIGHGCRKIAAAFENCHVTDQWYCQKLSAQRTCLCNQKVYSDELVERCYEYFSSENAQAARNVAQYRHLCLK
ncbi:MAG: hypothetical protein Q9228_007407 [Teloschistes exilis]